MNSLVLVLFLSLAFSAFFSGLEISFYQANSLRILLDKEKGILSARLMSFFIDHPSKFITNTLLGNNLALVIYGWVFTKLFEKEINISDPILLFILITLISTLIVLVIAEFLPKALFIINPDRTIRFFALPYWITFLLFFPISFFIDLISKFLLFLSGIKIKDKKPAFDFYDIFHIVNNEQIQNTNKDELELDRQMLINVIELPKVKARECMIPRTDIKAIDIEDSIENLTKMFIKTGHSKILVYKENIDSIIGFVHMTDLYDHPESIEDMLRPIIIIAESMTADKLLKQFTESKRSLGIVVDEFGGTAGVITIEDILEEIFGEIEDEYDKENLREVKVNDKKYIFSARLKIDYLNEKYNFNLPEGDYETLSGLILTLNENIPSVKDKIEYGNFKFEILTATQNRIDELQMTIN